MKKGIENNNVEVEVFKTKENYYRFGIFITNFKKIVNIKLNVPDKNEDWDKLSKKSYESRRFSKLSQSSNKWSTNLNNKIKNASIPADYPLNIFVNKICNESIFEIYLSQESKYYFI